VENMSILETVNKALPKFYLPFEYLAVEKVFVPFKERAVFKQYFPKQQKHLDMKIYKLCDCWPYVWRESVLGEWQTA
jgi:hypothetical protein